jgi:hypothetical protein
MGPAAEPGRGGRVLSRQDSRALLQLAPVAEPGTGGRFRARQDLPQIH